VSGALLFDGYFDNPVATAEAHTDDGWFRTGDVAAIDDDGFYSIVGG
jgi:fatty acid CoA ligase FadD36